MRKSWPRGASLCVQALRVAQRHTRYWRHTTDRTGSSMLNITAEAARSEISLICAAPDDPLNQSFVGGDVEIAAGLQETRRVLGRMSLTATNVPWH